MIDVRELFEAELRTRGVDATIDPESGRHAIAIGGARVLVSLENLRRDVASDADTSRVVRFVDAIFASASEARDVVDPAKLFWCLEPRSHVDKAEFLVQLSDQVDRVLCHWSIEAGLITWVTDDMLEKVSLDAKGAAARAFENLDGELREAKIEVSDIDGVRLGMIATRLPFKSSLILAPSAAAVLAPVLGWPLLAVVPDRDFLYLWADRHAEFTARVGSVAVREFQEAAYAISTEVFRLDDTGVHAVSAFPIPE